MRNFREKAVYGGYPLLQGGWAFFIERLATRREPHKNFHSFRTFDTEREAVKAAKEVLTKAYDGDVSIEAVLELLGAAA